MIQSLRHILILLLLVTSHLGFGQDFNFIAESSQNSVATGDRFKIVFSANGEIDNLKFPNLSNFKVLSGPNQSTNMSWVNGNMTANFSYSFILMAVKEGEFTISPAAASHKGKAYSTNPLKITVTKGINVQKSAQPNVKSNLNDKDVSNEVIVKSLLNKTTVYQGEQLIFTDVLYHRTNLSGSEIVQNHTFDGFWKQEIDVNKVPWEIKIIGGYKYRTGPFSKQILFPQRAGDLVINPVELNFISERRASGGNGGFAQFFAPVEQYEIKAKSNPLKVKVLPLPTKNQPSSFNGAVGKLSMSTSVSAQEVKANEAINLKIKISGKGNLPLIEEIPIEIPNDFESYDPKVDENYKTSGSGLSGSKEFDYLLIPRHEGTFTIAPIKFSYFDPSSKKYETIESEPFVITVNKGDGSAQGNVTYSGGNKEEVEIIGNDIRYIQLNGFTPRKNTTQFYGSLWYYLLIIICPILLVIAYFFRKKQRLSKQDLVGLKIKKAGKMAAKHLSSAKKSLAENNKSEFYENISKALFGYVGNKLNIPVAELSQENIKDKLIAVNVTETTSDKLMATLAMCDMARFAPISVAESEVFQNAEEIINLIEKEAQV